MTAITALEMRQGATIEVPRKPWTVEAMLHIAVDDYMLRGARGNELARRPPLQV